MNGLGARDALRLAAIVAAAFAASFLIPDVDAGTSTSSVFNTLLLFSFLSGFFINRALERRKTLQTSVEVELARLRRLWHMSSRVSDAEWGRRLREMLMDYHRRVGGDLRAYDLARDGYRDVAVHVYGFAPKDRRDELLFEDLLATTRDIALERRPLERSLRSRMPGYGRAVYLLIAASVGLLLLLNRGHGLTELSVALTLSGIIAVADLLFRTDRLEPGEIEAYQKGYRENLPEA